MKKWFVASLILKCEIAGQPEDPGEWTCIEQVHVIRAAGRDEAYEKALAIGKSNECTYESVDGNQVSWSFAGLENLEELLSKTIKDGTEIWGRVFYTQDPQALVAEKEELLVYYLDEIKNQTAAEILEDGVETKLVCNRIRS